jgi:hypothetical protein
MNKRKLWLAAVIIIIVSLAIVNFILMPKEEKQISVKKKQQSPQPAANMPEQKSIDETIKGQDKPAPQERKGEPLKGPLLN